MAVPIYFEPHFVHKNKRGKIGNSSCEVVIVMKQEFQCPAPKEALVDLRDVKLDSHMGQAERIRSFLRQIKDPYCFRVGDVVVNVAYTEGGATLNDCFADMLSIL